MNQEWFKAKQYGWGWYPATKEGWWILIGYILLVIFFNILLQKKIGTFVILVVCLTGILLWICWKTGEKPRWR